MKKLAIALLMVATGMTSVVAQDAKKEKGPRISIKGGDTHDFGKVKKGPLVYYTFEVINSGTEPLVIRDINPSCGCTSVEFESTKSGWDKMSIKPGKKGRIKVGLKTDEQHGNFIKDVSILSNAKNAGPDSRYPIHIKGEAIEDPNHPSKPAKH